MKLSSFGFLMIAALLALPCPAFAAPETIRQMILQGQQKRAIAEQLADQADKYAGEGKYHHQDAWCLDRIKADLKGSLGKTEQWVYSHLKIQFNANQAKASSSVEVVQAQSAYEKSLGAAQAYFDTRKQVIDGYEDREKVIEAHQQVIQGLGTSENYLFVITDHAVAFDGTFIDSMVLILTAVADLAFLPIEFLASVFTGW
jgi:hypothetical protein